MGTTESRPLLFRPTFGGIVVGGLFWFLSLFPTLLPRSWLFQALVSAVCMGIGYMIGSFGGFLVHLLLQRLDRQPSDRTRSISWRVLGVVGAVIVVVGMILWIRWQNSQRELVTLEALSWFAIVPMLVTTCVVFAVLFVIGRLIDRFAHWIDRHLSRHVPRLLSIGVTTLILVVIGVVISRDVVADGFRDWANDRFGAFDDTTAAGVEQPTSSLVSGSPQSLAPWDTLGYEGRSFVAGSTPASELDDTLRQGETAAEPIRVYVGLKSASSAAARADLAVRELERTGAFDRPVLIVATTTGTGWIDPDGAAAIEHLWSGHTAIVGLQYSFLPSWISFLVDKDKAAEAGEALNNAVYEAWSVLPEDARPKLIVFGESLGSYGAEAAFAGNTADESVQNLVSRTDGALFTGPTEANKIYGQLVAARDTGSPVWRPVYDGGTGSVQFINRHEDLATPIDPWPEPRILYVHHPSDPVGTWDWETIWSDPEWTERPRGYDVPSEGRWFPIVTWVQEVADLSAGFSAPAGYGHDYTLDFVGGFAAVVPPVGWTEADTDRLQKYLTAKS